MEISPIFPDTPLLISPPPPVTRQLARMENLLRKFRYASSKQQLPRGFYLIREFCVNLDVSKPGPSSLSGELEGEVPPMEPRKPCYDGCVGIVHHEIKSPLLPPLQNGDGSINEENRPKSKTMISKWKVIKAGLKVLYRKGMSKVRKFFVALRKLIKKYKKIAKKVKNYFLLFVVISVLIVAAITFIVSPLTAVPVLVFAGLIIAACKFFYDWSCKTQFKEDEKKNHGEEGSNIEKVMERFTGAIEELVNRMKVIEDKMKEDKNKDN